MRSIPSFACCSLLFLITISPVRSQEIPTDERLKERHWEASWVSVPGAPRYGYGVYHFRNEINLSRVPQRFVIHVSADNRYKLFVNGKWIGNGPARSDPDHWYYETYDIAAQLKEGKNVLAATVWNAGPMKPWAQLSVFTGFIVQGNSRESERANTPGSWQCIRNRAITPWQIGGDMGTVVGPGDRIEGAAYPWGWKEREYNSSEWKKPVSGVKGSPAGVGTHITHALMQRTIPHMEMKWESEPVIRRYRRHDLPLAHGAAIKDLEIPPNRKVTLLLDQKHLTNAYPHISLSGGEGSRLEVKYAESLVAPDGRKHHRDSVAGKSFIGNSDLFLPDGAKQREYTTLWFRTYRYVLLDVTTGDEALTLHQFRTLFTGYPFQEKATFACDDPRLDSIWEIGWRTARLCAHELYFDCPYYEQMQYAGDSRIQALISLYMSGDERLMRKAINDFYHSIIPEGLTRSRYPSEPRQVIPPYSLFWISMISDYLWHRPDAMFASRYLVSIQHILKWFEDRIDPETGMVGQLAYWPFVDWTDEWTGEREFRMGGVPDGGLTGNSSIITLQYAYTLDQAADIFNYFGLEGLARTYLQQADERVESTYRHCWDEKESFMADTPEKKSYSQHANILAVLTNAVPEDRQALLIERTWRSKDLIQASYYFRFYLHRAMEQAGVGNKYLDALAPWHGMVEKGLTTFADKPDPTRSDCHAWSASPLYDLLRTVAGIRTAEFGFRSVIIQPHPGNLQFIRASIPHPAGKLSVDLTFTRKNSVRGSVTLPPGIEGVFIWDGQNLPIGPGRQKVNMDAMDAQFRLDK